MYGDIKNGVADLLHEEPKSNLVMAWMVSGIKAERNTWLAQNYQHSSQVLVVFGFLSVVFITSVVVRVKRAAMKRFKELEKL